MTRSRHHMEDREHPDSLPMVEIFETVEGEGSRAGFPTTFVRLFHCNLRCVWCDTPYSYAPEKPAFYMSIEEITEKVKQFAHAHVCLTGGEPLIHGEKSLQLIEALARLDITRDIHIETNGAVDLTLFASWRKEQPQHIGNKVRFILDYKLPASGEEKRMITANFAKLREDDEIKFVIAGEEDFVAAMRVLGKWHQKGQPLFSPVWEGMPPEQLVELMLKHRLSHVKLSLQLHKIIWDPDRRGV